MGCVWSIGQDAPGGGGGDGGCGKGGGSANSADRECRRLLLDVALKSFYLTLLFATHVTQLGNRCER